jgi:ATP-dependent RNA helicase RhlE
MPFTSLGLLYPLQCAVVEAGYQEPTAIQQAAIPAILRRRDVLAGAPTGSGKTAAFCLPLLQLMLDAVEQRPRRTAVLILVPTRELASQIGTSLQCLARGLPRPPRIATLFGGVAVNPQMLDLRGGADIVVATPGRLLDLLDRNALQIGAVSSLVLDEADRMLDQGFAEEIQRILALLPAERQTLLFSATLPPAVQALAKSLLRDPVNIQIVADGEVRSGLIHQRAILVDDSRRTALLRHLVKEEGWTRVLVFVASKRAAERVADKLARSGLDAAAFHGELTQGRRNQVLLEFKKHRLQVLVATDVAARGLDIVELPVVVNYDLPRSAVDYTHRIGRTGRASASGLAVSFIGADSEAHFGLIERRHQLHLLREQVAGFEPADIARAISLVDPDSNGGIKGRRPSKKDKLRAAGLLPVAKSSE